MQGPAQGGLVRTNYRVRTASFAWCLLVVGLHWWEYGAGPFAWALAALQFLFYPHLLFWRAALSPRPAHAELDNLFLDAAVLGAWCAALGFPTWICFAMISATALNAVVNRGATGLAWSFACGVSGAVAWMLVRGLDYAPATSDVVTALCVVGTLAYVCVVGNTVYAQNRRLAAGRDALRRSEERYRMIAENAGDLIAMVDREGRWLYTSPSHRRVLAAPDLAVGTDAFQRAHPDDADLARSALLRASLTAKPRQIGLRLFDKDGRLRQYKTWIHALSGNRDAGLLLVSQDVSDLRESEERLLLAAHAFEGMTEAIVITATDGTIVTVNRAFCDLTGFARDDVLGQPERAIRNALQPPEYYDEVYAIVTREGHWSGTTWARRKNGSVYREWRSMRAVREQNGPVTHYVMVFSEVGGPGRAEEAKTA